MSDVLRHLVCNVKFMAFVQIVGFSLSQFAVIAFAFLPTDLQFLNDVGWFNNGQHRSSNCVDCEQYVSFIDKTSAVEPLVSIIPVDVNENESGVEETKDRQLEAS